MSNYDRLFKAGVLWSRAGSKIGTDDLKAIESLSPAEVDHLIRANAKLGPVLAKQQGGGEHTFVKF